MEKASSEIFDRLTSRELQVLQLFADGYGSKQTAHELGLQLNTVLKHASNIRAKLDAANRTHAVAIALRSRIIQ